MHYLLYFFLVGMAFVALVLTVRTKNFTLSLVSIVLNFAGAYGSMAVEIPHFFYDQSVGKMVVHTEYVQSIPLAAVFMLFGVISVVYAFFIPFEAAEGGEKRLRV